jgi:hypothetical protein
MITPIIFNNSLITLQPFAYVAFRMFAEKAKYLPMISIQNLKHPSLKDEIKLHFGDKPKKDDKEKQKDKKDKVEDNYVVMNQRYD